MSILGVLNNTHEKNNKPYCFWITIYCIGC